MSAIHVHFVRPLTEGEFGYLKAELPSTIVVTAGGSPPADTDILISGRPTREQLAATPRLRAVIVPYAGIAAETLALLRDFPGMTLHNVHHNAAPVAEMALMLLLAAAKYAVRYDRALRANNWHGHFGHDNSTILLGGKTALILGYGSIGRRVATYCHALGMVTLATRRRLAAPETIDGTAIYPQAALPDLLPRANVVIVCLPQTPQTDGLLGANELAMLPKGSVLVNIGRGPIIDEAALYGALHDGSLAAAGIDVWYSYPPDEAAGADWPPSTWPFRELDNVIMSPHRAGFSDGTPRLLMESLAGMLKDAAMGRAMPNAVDSAAGY